MLRLHDTATGTIRPLEHRTEGEVSMYVCGPTVYDLPHIGHGRYNLVFDVLRRYLLFCGFTVRYVSNITDVDDNIIKRANEQGRTEPDLAAEYEARWWEAMDALGLLRPDESPHATAYIEDMVTLVGDLLDRGVAYETSDGVYLNVEQVDGYGLLARQSLDSLRSGARVEANDEKRSPLDFAVWKKAKEGEPAWGAPWGAGRPGWHTECVVMSLDLLGDGFDLHGGGQDLAFPHHENERAQAVAEGRPFAQHWVHNGWVEVDGTKMSKSLGNFTSLTDLLTRCDERAYRLLVLRAHYGLPLRSPRRRWPTPRRRSTASTAWPGASVSVISSPRGGATWSRRSMRRTPIRTRWPLSMPAWMTTWTRPERWQASSSSSPPRTLRRLRATTPKVSAWPARLPSSPLRWVCRFGRGIPRSTRSRRGWWPSAMGPAPPRTSPGPTLCATSWVARGWTVEDAAAGTLIRR